MEIHRYLRRDREKEGRFPIRLVIHFNGQRLPLPTGEKVSEKGWDERKERAKGSEPYYLRINGKLDKMEAVLEFVFNALSDLPDPVTKETLRNAYSAVLEQVISSGEDPTEKSLKIAFENYLTPPAPVQEQAAKMPFLEWMDRWLEEEGKKVNLATGKKISIITIRGNRTTRNTLEAFEKYTGLQLEFAGMDRNFYKMFKAYALDVAEFKINTFGKHVKRLKQFLSWCDDQDEDLQVNRQFRKFESPSLYVGVDALSKEEVMAIYNLDFTSEAIKQQLEEIYTKKIKGEVKEGSFPDFLQQVEYARDILLMCCYTGLRISDASKLTPDHIYKDLIRIKTQKTNQECFIPYFDDAIFRPVEIMKKYEGKFKTCLPSCPRANPHLKEVAKLAKITRHILSTKIGRKTFVTLKIYQGVPTRLIMHATGHTTESSFNRYAGTDTDALIKEFKNRAGL